MKRRSVVELDVKRRSGVELDVKRRCVDLKLDVRTSDLSWSWT